MITNFSQVFFFFFFFKTFYFILFTFFYSSSSTSSSSLSLCYRCKSSSPENPLKHTLHILYRYLRANRRGIVWAGRLAPQLIFRIAIGSRSHVTFSAAHSAAFTKYYNMTCTPVRCWTYLYRISWKQQQFV